MGSKKSGRKSMLDPYKNEIKEMLESGYTYKRIADEISPKFDDVIEANTVCYFAKSRGLKSRITQGNRNGRIDIPCCENCEKCIEVKTANGTGTRRLCTSIWRLIGARCYTSPMDCPKRKEIFN